MPTERILFAAPGVQLGTYRCLPGDRAWREENTVGDGFYIAIPGPPVLIDQARARPVVANANHAIFYNDHEVYRRGLLSDRGDDTVYLRAEPGLLRQVAGTVDPGLGDEPEFRFPFVDGPLDATTHLRHRMLVDHLATGPVPDGLYAEEALLGLLGEVVASSVRAHRRSRVTSRSTTTDAAHGELVEATKTILSRRFSEPIALGDIAAEVHSSPFHLARIFRMRTGSSLHAYRTQLRLRASLERLADRRRDLAGLALDLGFASHSHFTDAFRGAFAMSPSDYRRATLSIGR